MKKSSLKYGVFAACAVVAEMCFAAIDIGAMPHWVYADTEVSTNFPLRLARNPAEDLRFSLEFLSCESNNVEVAFGHDADHDGVLSRGEAGLLVGWDCGEWKVVDCATGDEMVEQGTEGRVSLDWRLVFNAADVPRSLSATASGNPAFAALAANPPRFLYSTDWDMMRVVCRGMDSPSPSISGSIDNIPLSIRIR